MTQRSRADLLEQLPVVQAVQLLEEAEPDQAAAVVDELPSDLQADLLADLDDEDAEAILSHMLPAEALAAGNVESIRRRRGGWPDGDRATALPRAVDGPRSGGRSAGGGR
ncbi:MAG: hypothetical protein R3C56_03430 [Pirellulaceae bacterium]